MAPYALVPVPPGTPAPAVIPAVTARGRMVVIVAVFRQVPPTRVTAPDQPILRMPPLGQPILRTDQPTRVTLHMPLPPDQPTRVTPRTDQPTRVTPRTDQPTHLIPPILLGTHVTFQQEKEAVLVM